MTRRGEGGDREPDLSRGVAWSSLPALPRAFLRYTSRKRDPSIALLLLLYREVDAEFDAITGAIFEDIAAELDARIEGGDLDLVAGAETATFDYDTRLLMPAMLARGRVHIAAGDLPILRRVRPVDDDLLARGRETTVEVVRALLDGDMRDAINDEEYEDFETTARPRPAVAEIAQAHLQSRVEEWFDRPGTPEAVRRRYEHAVELSEGHQEEDRAYRDLLGELTAAADGDAGQDAHDAAAERVRTEYKFADSTEATGLFRAERDLPYFATQYERVGVIYEDMLGMYEADLGIELSSDFKRSIVLMVIAAQIGLDDTDDYPEDRGTQLTPVTAELNLAGPEEGPRNLRWIVETYLDRADGYSGDHMTGMAIAFIRQQALDRLADLAATVR